MTTLPKVYCQNSKKFLLEFEKLWKIDELSKKTYLSNLSSEHVQRNFHEPAVTMPSKVHRIFFTQSLKMIAMQLFRKKTIFPSFLLSKNEKKSASGHAKCSCGNRAKKFLVKLLKTFAGLSVNDQKMISFLKNLFVKKFVWTCTMKFWRASRNIVGKKTKNTPNLQKRWIYNFLSKYVFFHQKLFFSTGECIFENALKVFSPKIYRFAAQSPETTKKTEFFERKIYFLKMFLIHVECSCDNPAKCF